MLNLMLFSSSKAVDSLTSNQGLSNYLISVMLTILAPLRWMR